MTLYAVRCTLYAVPRSSVRDRARHSAIPLADMHQEANAHAHAQRRPACAPTSDRSSTASDGHAHPTSCRPQHDFFRAHANSGGGTLPPRRWWSRLVRGHRRRRCFRASPALHGLTVLGCDICEGGKRPWRPHGTALPPWSSLSPTPETEFSCSLSVAVDVLRSSVAPSAAGSFRYDTALTRSTA